jgi:integrase
MEVLMGVRGSVVRKEFRGGKPRWVIDFRYRDKDGRERRFRRDATVQMAGAARAEAERLHVQAVTTGTLEARSRAPTFREFADAQFTEIYMPAKCRPATRDRYRALFGQGIFDALGSKRLDEIEMADFRSYGAELARRGVQSRPHFSLVRTVLRAAVELGVLDRLPELPKLPKQSKKLRDAPTTDEVQQMLAHATGWLRPAIALAALAGLRMGEVRALEVRDIDFERDLLLVRRAFSLDEVMSPKSGDERVVPLSPELREILVGASRRKLPTARVVTNAHGRTPGRQCVLSKLKALQARHGLTSRSFHSLRHYFCSVLIRHGASIEAVRVLAGHSKLDVTQRYVHANAADLTAAIAKLPGN